MDKKLNKNVAKVYTVITGGLYPDPDTDSSWILDEFNELYGELVAEHILHHLHIFCCHITAAFR